MKAWEAATTLLFFAIMFVSLHVGHDEGYEKGRASILDSLDLTPHPRVEAKLTAYSPDARSCGKWADGKTATMRDASLPGVAVDPKVIPYGSIIVIDGEWYIADDTGGAMRQASKKGKVHIDIRMPTHEDAMEFGVRTDTITVIMR